MNPQTQRRDQVVQKIKHMLITSGASNKEMADAIGLAEKTIKAHMTALMKAYEQRNRTALALHLLKQAQTLPAYTPSAEANA